MAKQIWWADAFGDEAFETACLRECSAQAFSGEPQPRQGNASGCHKTKAVRTERARELGGYFQASCGVSERRACDAFPSSGATIR